LSMIERVCIKSDRCIMCDEVQEQIDHLLSTKDRSSKTVVQYANRHGSTWPRPKSTMSLSASPQRCTCWSSTRRAPSRSATTRAAANLPCLTSASSGGSKRQAAASLGLSWGDI
jgi:hypothetical protein